MTNKSQCRLGWIVAVCIACQTPLLAKDEKSAEEMAAEYKERVEKANLEAFPEKHQAMASWCKRNYPEKYELHMRAYHEYQFSQLENALPVSPSPDQLKALIPKAEKLELPDKAKELRTKWGEAQFAIHEKKLKPGDVKLMQMLLKWAMDNQVEYIDPVRKLAEDILKDDGSYLPAHKALGHVEVDGKWTSIEEMIGGINIRDPKARLELHRKLTAGTAGKPRDLLPNPDRGMIKEGDLLLASTEASGGQAKYFIGLNGYSKGRGAALVISLHGGGEGGFEAAKSGARIGANEFVHCKFKGGCVILAPIARSHVTNSWGTLSNFEDLLDAMEDTRARFNIDMKRIYITGQSMGGGGTSLYYLCFPELAAASCARAGFYFRDGSVKDVLEKPIMVIQGEKDEAFRISSRDELLKQVKDAGGKLTHISLPDTDHFIPATEVLKNALPYFEEFTNDIEPDLRVIRAAGRSYFK
ncbi:MAG: dienelactone hydrolase family protein [Verrucomicrobia bacterium]|nr:dienelactone hydrolase family protein [Verrucomicrobiota bacterium]